MRKIIMVVLWLAMICNGLWADGKMYSGTEHIKPSIPYQRAFIIFENQTETLILQSKYSFPVIDGEFAKMPETGWVVPLPSEPELASMPADDADEFFDFVSIVTRPLFTNVSKVVLSTIYVIVVVLAVIYFVWYTIDSLLPFSLPFENYPILQKILYFSSPIIFASPFLLPSSSRVDYLSVDVVKSASVGIYDVQVVKSDNSEALIGWLNDKQFRYEQQDKAVFDSYIAKGWCFVVAELRPDLDVDKKQKKVTMNGLAAPLILRFASDTPIYPMALTGSGGFDTEVVVYLATDKKMTCNGQMTLHYAKQRQMDASDGFQFELFYSVEPKGFIKDNKVKLPYLCKFRDVLTPEKMKDDIIFYPDADQSDYREHVIKWWF